MKIQSLHIYPIKSLGGIQLNEATLTGRGFELDRRYMLVDQEFNFLSQRSLPIMALIKIRIDDDRIFLKYQQQEISFSLNQSGDFLKRNVEVWSSSVTAKAVSKEVDQWFSEILNQACTLAYMPESTERKVDSLYGDGEIVSFADGYPYLIANTNSLKDLNSKMDIAVKIDRFRANIIVDGDTAFEEDTWKEIQIGQQIFNVAKPCARCEVTTINQQDGSINKAVLKTLSSYRMKGNNVFFGQNLCWINKENATKTIKVGDELTILKQTNLE